MIVTDESLAAWDAIIEAATFPPEWRKELRAWDELGAKVTTELPSLIAYVRGLRADIKKERATATWRNACLAELVAIVAQLDPSHEVLTRLPYSQIAKPGVVDSSTERGSNF